MRSVTAVLMAVLAVACQDPAVPNYELSPVTPTVQTPTTLSLAGSGGQGDQATQAIITATLKDQAGRGIPGSLLTFSSSKGFISPTGVVTNNSGDARTTLTSGTSAMVTVSGAGLSSAMPVTIIAPLSVSLNVPRLEKNVTATLQASIQSTNAAPPIVYVWEFGDGQTARTDVGRVSHTYADDGRILIAVTVSDALERTGRASADVTVRDNAAQPSPPTQPTPTPTGFTLVLSCATQTALRVDCVAVGSFDGAPLPSSFLTNVSWDWGDGTVQLGNPSRTHVYPAAGTYPIFVSATYGPKTVAATTNATAK